MACRSIPLTLRPPWCIEVPYCILHSDSASRADSLPLLTCPTQPDHSFLRNDRLATAADIPAVATDYDEFESTLTAHETLANRNGRLLSWRGLYLLLLTHSYDFPFDKAALHWRRSWGAARKALSQVPISRLGLTELRQSRRPPQTGNRGTDANVVGAWLSIRNGHDKYGLRRSDSDMRWAPHRSGRSE